MARAVVGAKRKAASAALDAPEVVAERASMRHAMITKNQKPTTALSVALYAGVRFLGGYEIYAN